MNEYYGLLAAMVTEYVWRGHVSQNPSGKDEVYKIHELLDGK
jgi:hypothetical protein